MANEIIVKGACENNLKSIDVKIPRDKLVVLTGLSGSGIIFLLFYELSHSEGGWRKTCQKVFLHPPKYHLQKDIPVSIRFCNNAESPTPVSYSM